RQRRQVHQITEQDGELAAFGVQGRRRGWYGEALRVWRVSGASRYLWLGSRWGGARGHVCTARPDQHFPIFIHRDPLALNEFSLQVLQVVVIQVELALEGAIRQA